MIDPELSARLTLLAARAAVPEEIAVIEGRCAVGSHSRPVGLEEAVALLKALPKPYFCYPTVSDGTLSLDERVPASWREMLTFERPEPFKEWDRKLFGNDYLGRPVLCVGHREWIFATFADLYDWESEYPAGRAGHFTVPFAEAPTASENLPASLLEEAAACGTVAIRIFGLSKFGGFLSGRIWIERIAPASSEPPDCERCAGRPARFVIHWFELAQAPRRLCQRCIDDVMTVPQFDAGRALDRQQGELAQATREKSAEELAVQADELAMWWALRYTPPFIREFIARHRRA